MQTFSTEMASSVTNGPRLRLPAATNRPSTNEKVFLVGGCALLVLILLLLPRAHSRDLLALYAELLFILQNPLHQPPLPGAPLLLSVTWLPVHRGMALSPGPLALPAPVLSSSLPSTAEAGKVGYLLSQAPLQLWMLTGHGLGQRDLRVSIRGPSGEDFTWRERSEQGFLELFLPLYSCIRFALRTRHVELWPPS